mgnify:CR=1 FL=1|tara:strand:+ start:1082 stop:1369 length:288 start_codon:yes stop_codon:yes gene_type:complete
MLGSRLNVKHPASSAKMYLLGILVTQKKIDSEQMDRFKQAAKDVGADESEAAFEEKLKRIASAPKSVVHASDCSEHDAPAFEPGPCTCGAAKAGR